MKKFLFSIIVLGVLVAMVYQPVIATLGTSLTPGQVVERAFKASNGQLHEIKVEGWAKVNNQYLTIDELTEVGWQAAGAISKAIEEQMPSELEWQVASGEAFGQRQIELTAKSQAAEISVLLQSFIVAHRQDNSSLGETYLIVTATAPATSQVVSLEYQVSQAFSPFNELPRLAVLFIGTLKANIHQEGKEQLVEGMLQAVEGRKIEGISEDFLVSYSGHTRLIPTGWWTGDRELNLQIAVRDHSNKESTLIYVGYPLILTGY